MNYSHIVKLAYTVYNEIGPDLEDNLEEEDTECVAEAILDCGRMEEAVITDEEEAALVEFRKKSWDEQVKFIASKI